MLKPLTSFKEVSGQPEIDKKRLIDYIAQHTFDPTRKPNEDDSILFLQGIPIGTKGNIVSITGKSKSRKTIAASAISTAIFSEGESFLGFTSLLSPDAKLLHIDTEQGYKHYYHSIERIFKDAVIHYQSRFTSIHTRDADIPTRLEIIDYMVEQIKPEVLIIDGMTDLVYDINDQIEAGKIMEKFMQISSKYNLLVIGVIHTTKTTGFMTGAIGTIFEKKSETVIKVELDEKDKMVSHIECQYSRNRPFETFSIRADENNQYSLVNESEVIKDGQKDYINFTEDQHKAFLEQVFGENATIPVEKMQKMMNSTSNQTLNFVISRKIASNWLEKYKTELYLQETAGQIVRGPRLLQKTLDVFQQSTEESPF